MSREVRLDEGLRERKRAATQAAIERTAVNLVLEHGYENVTVAMICEASTVSRRTFFNYFGSKEGVILGATPPLPGQDQIDAFVNKTGANVLDDFLTMIVMAFVDHEADLELFTARRDLIQRTPELLSREMVRMGELEEQFVAIVMTRFLTQGRQSNEPSLEDEARIVVALATGVVHYAMRKWLDSGSATATRDVLRESITLIRRVTGNE